MRGEKEKQFTQEGNMLFFLHFFYLFYYVKKIFKSYWSSQTNVLLFLKYIFMRFFVLDTHNLDRLISIFTMGTFEFHGESVLLIDFGQYFLRSLIGLTKNSLVSAVSFLQFKGYQIRIKIIFRLTIKSSNLSGCIEIKCEKIETRT